MDWTDLNYFLVVAHTGALSRAARELKVNHSTILRRLGALEDALGVRLFDRQPSGYRLTAAGERLSEQLGGMREQVESAERQLAGADTALRGTIRLTTTDTMVHGVLMPHLKLFGAQHPRIELQIVVNNTFLNLTKREADVAVRASNTPPENLIGRRVGSIQTAPYVARSLAKGQRKRALTDFDWVALDESLGHLAQARWLEKNIAPERVRMRFDSLVAMVDAVKHGAGAAMLLCPLADGDKDLVRLAPPDAEMDTQVWVLTHPDLRNVARVRAISEFLYERLSRDPRLVHERVARKRSGT
jgi:DNA-binding transcriptional LysR family regulator